MIQLRVDDGNPYLNINARDTSSAVEQDMMNIFVARAMKNGLEFFPVMGPDGNYEKGDGIIRPKAEPK